MQRFAKHEFINHVTISKYNVNKNPLKFYKDNRVNAV